MPYSKANLIERGRRPLTPMSPTIVLDYRRSMKLVIGAVGGKKVLSVIAQVRYSRLCGTVSTVCFRYC